MATVAFQKEKYQDALSLYKQSLDLWGNDAEGILSYMIDTYMKLGEYEKSEKIIRQLITKWEWEGWYDHPRIANLLYSLGSLYLEQSRFTDAELAFAKALEMQENVLGADHLQIAISLTGLAKTHYKQGVYLKAEPLVKRALAIREKQLSSEHPLVVQSRRDYSNVLRKLGRENKVREL